MNNPQRSEAHRLIDRSVKRGEIKRPGKCETCGAKQRVWHSFSNDKVIIVAHHWRGYNYPLDVWFICHSCNALFRGQHNGKANKGEIKQVFGIYAPVSKVARLSNLTNDQVNHRIKKGKCPGAKKLSDILNSNSGLKTDPWFIPKSLLPLPEKL